MTRLSLMEDIKATLEKWSGYNYFDILNYSSERQWMVCCQADLGRLYGRIQQLEEDGGFVTTARFVDGGDE